jgi:parallel beta-helix repeat protein
MRRRIRKRCSLDCGFCRRSSPETFANGIDPQRNHLVAHSLKIPSGVTVIGVPGRTIIKPAPTNTDAPVLVHESAVSNVTITGIIFDGGTADGQFNINDLINISESSNVVFDRIIIQNAAGIGAAFTVGTNNSGLRNCIVKNVGNYWQITQSEKDQKQGVVFCCGSTVRNRRNFVINTEFHSTGLDAVSMANQTDAIAANNKFYTVGGRYSHGGAAIYAAVDTGLTLSGNEIIGTFGNGIDIYRVTDFLIVGNRVQSAGAAGIVVSGSAQGMVINNITIDGNQGDSSSLKGGLAVGGNRGDPATNDVIFLNNTSSDNQQTKTQTYGYQILETALVGSIWLDSSNNLRGNVIAPFGGRATSYSARGPR